MKIFIIFLSLPKVYIQPPLWYTRRAMENPRENPLPLPTIRRYPIFLRAIGEMMDAGEAFISSSVLAERLGLDPVLTRKDLAMAGVPGRPRRGYPAEELRAAINRALGWDSATDAVLVGAGSWGAPFSAMRASRSRTSPSWPRSTRTRASRAPRCTA